MGDGVVAGDHHVELPPVMVMNRPQVAHGEIDLKRPALRLGPGPGDRPGRQVGGGDGEARLRQAEGLGADAAGDIEDGSAPRPPAPLHDADKLPGLPLDTGIPVLKDQVVETHHSVVKFAHRPLLPQRPSHPPTRVTR